ncbi:MAG TPA: threonylcarbamoyl-AMP synthase [Gammaproteobacteria bacterium]|jgi:tRNA threonylcarbamoyl adenosine modification protein (Sua5/YciO/YrdC/YwlC family)|uniref:L-threonylcarbamoyladenylate synthase n=1 Tax=Immundisolibacter sp. TaxID=1934948 RepID=UPI000E82804F|nr:threonylcarbamoyl-AMP synthase [Gammaproteobacteria bacterium]HCZ48340.1 threonylcarbamoyl-AMP synthase [Gammaproteobacteria bacterium]MCH77778.1 threonylcarbamoyl-AMP synthase [Gammaproteobacteria bacterium]
MQRFHVHPDNPQQRLLGKAAEALARGALLACPTDCSYVLLCEPTDKTAVERIRALRRLDGQHPFTLLCRDLSQVSTYATLGTAEHRLLRASTPGPYTFVLPATREVPKRLQDRRRAAGIRISDHAVPLGLLALRDAPLLSSTLQLPDDEFPLVDPDDIAERLGKHIDLLLDAGPCDYQVSTVVAFEDGVPQVIRPGKGDLSRFGA